MGLFDSFKKSRGKVSASRGSIRKVGLVVKAYERGIVFKDLRYRYYVLRDNDFDDVVFDSFEDEYYDELPFAKHENGLFSFYSD